VKPSCDLSLVLQSCSPWTSQHAYRLLLLLPVPVLRSQQLQMSHPSTLTFEWKAKRPFADRSFDGFNKNQIRILCLARHLEFRRSVDRDIFLVYHINSFPSAALTMGRTRWACLTRRLTPPCPLDYHSLHWSRLALTLPSSCAVLVCELVVWGYATLLVYWTFLCILYFFRA
jgi:hypothetical protein